MLFNRKSDLSNQELAYSELLDEIAKDGAIFKDGDTAETDESIDVDAE